MALSPKAKRILTLAGAALSLLLAANTAEGLAGRVRKVDIVLLFGTGMSAGVTLADAIRSFIKRERKD